MFHITEHSDLQLNILCLSLEINPLALFTKLACCLHHVSAFKLQHLHTYTTGAYSCLEMAHLILEL